MFLLLIFPNVIKTQLKYNFDDQQTRRSMDKDCRSLINVSSSSFIRRDLLFYSPQIWIIKYLWRCKMISHSHIY